MAYFRKRGEKWEYRIKYTDRQTGTSKEKSKGGFRTKKEAQLAAADEELKIDQFGFSDNGTQTLEEYILEWLETHKEPKLKPITYSLQERVVRLNILPRWSNYKLRDITRIEYQKWINELVESYSVGTIRRIHSIFSTAMNDAVHDFNILRVNPLIKIQMPVAYEKKEKLHYFTKEQLELFLSNCKPVKNAKYQHSIQYYVLFNLLSRTGLRIGEALALKWSDIEDGVLSVNKTLVYPTNSTPYISTPKTDCSIRKIKLDEFMNDLLNQHKVNQTEVHQLYKNFKKPTNDIVFYQHDGRWLRTNVVRDYFKEVCKRCDLPVLSPHALRHSHAVHMLEAGINIKYVSERLGHASVKITADTYLHVSKKVESDALSLYENYINK